VSVKLPGPLFIIIIIIIILMGFVFCDSYYSTGALCTMFTLVYYKREGGAFPQVWAVVSLVSPCLPVARPCTKSAQTTH